VTGGFRAFWLLINIYHITYLLSVNTVGCVRKRCLSVYHTSNSNKRRSIHAYSASAGSLLLFQFLPSSSPHWTQKLPIRNRLYWFEHWHFRVLWSYMPSLATGQCIRCELFAIICNVDVKSDESHPLPMSTSFAFLRGFWSKTICQIKKAVRSRSHLASQHIYWHVYIYLHVYFVHIYEYIKFSPRALSHSIFMYSSLRHVVLPKKLETWNIKIHASSWRRPAATALSHKHCPGRKVVLKKIM